MKKIVTVIGARPQFIKAAPVSKAIASHSVLKEIIVHTGQHYDQEMSEVFFKELEIPSPEYNLDVGSGSHAYQTAEIMKKLEPILIEEKPHLLLIYGDTNSTLAAALTGAKLHIPIAHVEAGLRSFNMRMPEEINRIIADRLSTVLFAPTTTAVENLTKEGISKGVYKTGDVMYDVALHYTPQAQEKSKILEKLDIKSKEYILATVHRAENTDDQSRLKSIFTAFYEISNKIQIVLPLHPRTRKMIKMFEIEHFLNSCIVIDPVGFLDMICLEHNAKLIMTDSGGIQKEAYFHKVPCITLREETEWIETIESGWNILSAQVTTQDLIRSYDMVTSDNRDRNNIGEYGDGHASDSILSILKTVINNSKIFNGL